MHEHFSQTIHFVEHDVELNIENIHFVFIYLWKRHIFIQIFFSLLRYISYCQFVQWIWPKLGKHRREILPSCVVNEIHCAFPSEEYAGFKYPVIPH